MAEKTFNCPNCAAPISGEKCKYCGTVIYDFASIKLDDISYLKISNGNQILRLKAILKKAELEYGNEILYENGVATFTKMPRPRTFEVEFDILEVL